MYKHIATVTLISMFLLSLLNQTYGDELFLRQIGPKPQFYWSPADENGQFNAYPMPAPCPPYCPQQQPLQLEKGENKIPLPCPPFCPPR